MKEPNSSFNPKDIELNVENKTNISYSLYNETIVDKNLLPLEKQDLKKEDEFIFKCDKEK